MPRLTDSTYSREIVLSAHTAAHRAIELEAYARELARAREGARRR